MARLIRLILALGLFGLVQSAFAWGEVGKSVTTCYTASYNSFSVGCQPSADAALTAIAAAMSAQSDIIVAGSSWKDPEYTFKTTCSAAVGAGCYGVLNDVSRFAYWACSAWHVSGSCGSATGLGSPGTGTLQVWVIHNPDTLACPNNATSSGANTCTCSVGFKKDSSGACVPYSCQAGATSYPNAGYGPFSDIGLTTSVRLRCQEGCTIEFTPKSGKCADSSHCWAVGSEASNGEYCDGVSASPTTAGVPRPTTESPGAPPPEPCSQGMCPGTVNGQSVCVACSKEAAPGPSQTSSSPAGTQTTETKTECMGSTCTTTTTTKDGNGTVLKTDTKQEPKLSFCEENKASPICKQSSFGAAACGAVPACEGDAVQCAIAQEQFKRNCEFFNPAGGAVDAGNAGAAAGNRASDHPANSPDAQAVNFGTSISTSNPIGGGCPSDDNLSVGGIAITIPWSRVCGSLQLLGQLVVAVGMLASAFIVFRN